MSSTTLAMATTLAVTTMIRMKSVETPITMLATKETQSVSDTDPDPLFVPAGTDPVNWDGLDTSDDIRDTACLDIFLARQSNTYIHIDVYHREGIALQRLVDSYYSVFEQSPNLPVNLPIPEPTYTSRGSRVIWPITYNFDGLTTEILAGKNSYVKLQLSPRSSVSPLFALRHRKHRRGHSARTFEENCVVTLLKALEEQGGVRVRIIQLGLDGSSTHPRSWLDLVQHYPSSVFTLTILTQS